MKPHLHANASVRRYGGVPEDYQDIHDWFDQTKAHVPDMRHRAILHSSFGIYLAEQVFGITRKNSDGKIYSVRDVGENHVLEDLQTIPTVQDYLKHMTLEPWMGGKLPNKKRYDLMLNRIEG
jgi:hypothetical protein